MPESKAILDPALAQGLIADLRLHLPAHASSDSGRVFLHATVDGESVTIAFHSSPSLSTSSRVASATGGIGTLSIEAANDSGVRGSCTLLSIQAFTLEAFVNFAFADDLRRLEHGIDRLLDANKMLEGRSLFDAFLEGARDEALAIIQRRVTREIGEGRLQQPLALAIANPHEVTRLVAMIAHARLMQWHQGAATLGESPQADRLWLNAYLAFDALTILLRPSKGATHTYSITINRQRVMRG